MANQVVVTQSGNVQVSIQPTPNVQVQVSRAAIGTIAISNVANANYANFAGQVVDASQPNITSLGTVTGLTSTGNITAPYFLGNVVGNISGNIVVPGTNTSVLFNQQGSAGASDAFQFNYATNVATITGNLSATNISGNGAGLSSITGANVTGQVGYAAVANSVSGSNVTGAVAYATTANSVAGGNVSGQVAYAAVANSVAGANVSGQVNYAAVANSVAVGNVAGIGNIATVNLTGSASNVLYGNGVFAPASGGGGDANYANFAGTAFNVSGSNVNGAVNLANFATTANSVAGANVSGQVGFAAVANSVAVGNVSGIGNIAVINLDGNGANVLHGNGVFAPESQTGNANYAAYAGNVTINAQPNITSVGTLTGLTVNGNATIGNITSVDSVTFDTANVGPGAVAQLTWNDGDGTLDLGLKGGNVTLQVGEQQYARVNNNTGTTLTKGEVVYVVGASGNRVAVSRAQANAEATSTGTLGFVAESITAGGEGFVITGGALYRLNTLGYTAGATVFLSPTVAGGWTTTKPAAPDQLVVLGWIERVSATVGSIYIKVDNGYELDELHNVLITSPVSGQALVFDGGNLWVNGNPNVANIAYSVSGSNVNGAVNLANFASVANSVAGANVSGQVSFAAVANSVAGANVSGAVNLANFAGVANSVAVANVSGIGNIATVNLDGNVSNLLTGAGTFVAIPTGGGDANFANFAGNVTVAAQANITSLGNLVALTVRDSNVSNPITQVLPTGNVVGTALLPNNMIRIDNYNDQGNANGIMGVAFVKSRGNATTPAAAANNDPVMRLNNFVFNGNTQAKAVMIETTAPVAAQANLQLANTAWTGGAFRVTTGNPEGAVANSSASSSQNLLQYNQNSTLSLLAGAPTTTTVPSISVLDYGVQANSVGGSRPMLFQRARGNRDGNLAVANTDTIGSIGFQPFNGNAFFNTRFATIRANVNTAHGTIANGASVPTDLQFITVNNTSAFTTTFFGNGSASFPGAVSTSGNVSVTGNISATANISAGNISTGQLNGSNSVTIIMDNISTVNPSFAFSTYNNSNTLVNPYTFFRSRGTVASPAAVQTGDAISSIGYNVYADAGNTYKSVATVAVSVNSNDGVGNVPGTYSVTANNISLIGNVAANNIAFTKFNETVVSGGSVSGTITPNAAAGTIYTYTLTGNITLNSLANVATGTSMTIILTQDGTGGRTLTSTMLFAGGSKTLSTSAGAKDIVSVFYDGSTYYATLSKGYA